MNSDPRSAAIHRICGHVILVLTLFALSLVVGATVLAQRGRFSPAADGDEGTPAHLFQLAVGAFALLYRMEQMP